MKEEAILWLTKYLPTTSERRLFLLLIFGKKLPNCIAVINLEGTAQNAAWNIWQHFEHQGMEAELHGALKYHFILE